MAQSIDAPLAAGPTIRDQVNRYWPGLLLTGVIAMASTFVSGAHGGPVMLYALLFGVAFHFLSTDEKFAAGVGLSSSFLLRLGVALLGARITVDEIATLGAPTIALVVAGVAFTIGAGWAIGRAMGLSARYAILSAGAVGICGASAALAIAAVLPRERRCEQDAILTVVGVTALSTVAMIVYPVGLRALGVDAHWAGVFLGATIHDVAQVVGAGYMISDDAGATAALVKLLRVACLAPVVMAAAWACRERRSATADGALSGAALRGGAASLAPPWFLIAFFVLVVINSAAPPPAALADGLADASRWLLTTAVAALGVKTSLKEVFRVGARPLLAMLLQTIALAGFTALWIAAL